MDVSRKVIIAEKFALNPQLGGRGTSGNAVLSLNCMDGLKLDITMLGAFGSIATPPQKAGEVFGE